MDTINKFYIYCPTCKNSLEKKNINGEYVLTCNNCGFTFWNNPKPVVSFLFIKKGKILLLQRAHEPLRDYWCFPGGFMRYEETPKEAVKREVKEETGLNIQIDGLVGVYRIDNDPRGVHIDIIYSGTGIGEIKLSTENNDYAFYESDKLPELIAYKHREAIRNWLEKKR